MYGCQRNYYCSNRKNRAIDGFNRNLILKNITPFINNISKINNVLTGNSENLDVAIPMYNLIEYSKNYRNTTGSLWNYDRDEPTNSITNEENLNLLNKSKSADDNTKEVESVVPLK